MRRAPLLGGLAAALALLPAALASETPQTLYFHPDGRLDETPGAGSSASGLYRAAPAGEAFVLRAGAAIQVRGSGVLEGPLRATLLRNGEPLGTGSLPGGALPGEATLRLDNPETAVSKGDVLSVGVETGGGLLGSAVPVSLLLARGAAPAPPPSPTPATPPAGSPTPPVLPLPPPAPTPASAPAAGGAATAPRSDALPEVPMPWESASGGLMLLLVAATALGGWSIVRLGRI